MELRPKVGTERKASLGKKGVWDFFSTGRFRFNLYIFDWLKPNLNLNLKPNRGLSIWFLIRTHFIRARFNSESLRIIEDRTFFDLSLTFLKRDLCSPDSPYWVHELEIVSLHCFSDSSTTVERSDKDLKCRVLDVRSLPRTYCRVSVQSNRRSSRPPAGN